LVAVLRVVVKIALLALLMAAVAAARGVIGQALHH
jgi:hypothetical protein